MKKIFFLLFIPCAALANALVYCPDKIDCTTESCVFEQEPMEYWASTTRTSETILPGEYSVSYVSAPYHIEDGGYAICVYTHSEVYATRMLRAKSNANLIVFEDGQTQWRHEESWGECRPEPQEACPLYSP